MATDTELVVGAPLTFSIDVEPLHSIAITPQAGEVVIIVPVPGPPGEQGDTGPAGDGTQVFNETPAGVLNGANVTFTTANQYQEASTAVYTNGLREHLGVDYVESSDTSGVTFTTQPANGLYKVSAVSTNITVARAPEQSGSVQPAGDFVFVEGGSFAGGGFVVTTPSAASGFTYGTNNIVWTQFSGAGEITAGNVLSKSGNTIQVSSMSTNQIILGNAGTPTITTLSGDATIGATGVVTIAGGAVSLSKQAPLAANSVIANNTGSSATPTALGLTAAATASTAMLRDGNANVKANNYARGVATTTTAAGTTTLTVGSAQFQQATGTTTQTYVLPDATTLVTGQSFIFSNQSTGALTINANGGGLIRTVAAGTSSTVTLIANGSAAGTWDPGTTATATGTVTAVSVASSNGFTGSSSGGATPALTIATSVTGLVKGNGTALSAATAGTDYLAPSGQVVRETPGGTINGSTTAFTLANTPTSGSEMVFKNGLLQIAGGTDYSISGATLTFTTAPESGANLMVSYSK
jgi:hypothetical protein